ncbi:MAG TPA: amylo-alpha-1,6-glucosidase [Candidatus Acidoferrales bacterium]|nr:amylo-alpha-1,6-glucosidase [Candidatus Acidoferrales bacterium]
MSFVTFGRSLCCDLAAAESREWLVTNGLGGFASGTVAGTLTRRYHALLIAALEPPVGRTYLVSKFNERATFDGRAYALSADRWASGVVTGDGFAYLARFRLDGSIPTWEFACGEMLLEKRIWMEQGANTTYVRYRLLRGRTPVNLRLEAMVNYRDFHATTHAGDWQMRILRIADGVVVHAFDGATPFALRARGAQCEPAHEWYRDYALRVERLRGLDAQEDHLHAATFEVTLTPGASVTIVASSETAPSTDGEAALERRREHERSVLGAFAAAHPGRSAPRWITQLALAADQFIVARPLREDPQAQSVIAGYHWFGDWGRDTMIALPGLALTTGRAAIAATILRTFARYLDGGMLPNFFPDSGQVPQYNTIDASLWYIVAVASYVETTGDDALLRDLWPALEQIIGHYRSGTRYGIQEDADDGLIRGGQDGVQLTWMDVKIGDWVVTPRIGKPVEINALWYHAQRTMADFAQRLNVAPSAYAAGAQKTRAGFARFWNEARGYCFDVVDGPHGNEDAIRPNAIFAVSLRYSPLDERRARAVVEVCGRELLTAAGLRSLAPGEPGFRSTYRGSPAERDAAYHQGTAWGWLLGPWASAHLRVYKDPAAALTYLADFAEHLDAPGIGTLAEIADATAPFCPQGAIAQAWSVGEVLRAWLEITAAA